MAIETLNIEDLDRNGLQTRVALDEATVEDYAEAMRGGAEFPPVTAFCDGTAFYLADGFHRTEAALRCGFASILADVRAGSFADSLKHALGANAHHGLRRTNADKQRCLQLAWQNRRALFGANDPTAEWLAATCGVSDRTVKSFYEQMRASCADMTPCRASSSGRTYAVPPVPTREGAGATHGARVTKTDTTVKRGYHIAEDGAVHADGIRLDRFHAEIPPALDALFADTRLADWAKRVHAVKLEIRAAAESGDRIAADLQRAMTELGDAGAEIEAAAPYCVCRMCRGRGCRACGERGYQTKLQYARVSVKFK